MNRPALAVVTLALLGGGWWYLRRTAAGVVVDDASSSTAAPLSWDFTWPSFDLAAPLAAIDNAAQAVIESVADVVTPDNSQTNPNVQAFCRAIRLGEGTSDANGYRRIFGGRLFDSFADHPRIKVTAVLGGRSYTSDAAGAYQALSSTWDDFIRAAGPHDFSPASQDEFAVWAIRRRGALADVKAGRFESAVAKCAKEWASLPGSPYGQPTVSLAQVKQAYEGAGGVYG